MFFSTVTAALSLCLLTGSLAAQEAEAPKEQQPDPQKVLDRCLRKMSTLGSVAFRTNEKQDNASQRQMMKRAGGGFAMGGGGSATVRGQLADGVLQATLNNGDDEVLLHKGRMVARTPDEEWKPRRGRLYGGAAMPFVLEPRAFFENLAMLGKGQRKIRRVDTITQKGKKLTVISITLDGEAAQDFALAGALPKVSSGFGAMMIGGMGMGGQPADLPELTVDIALYVDGESGYVHRVRSSTYQEDQGMGNVRIAIGGMGGGDEEEDEDEEDEEDEVKERDANGKRIYKNGLPIRDLGKDLSKMEFGIRFSKHGMPIDLEIEPRCRKLLRLSGNNK